MLDTLQVKKLGMPELSQVSCARCLDSSLLIAWQTCASACKGADVDYFNAVTCCTQQSCGCCRFWRRGWT